MKSRRYNTAYIAFIWNQRTRRGAGILPVFARSPKGAIRAAQCCIARKHSLATFAVSEVKTHKAYARDIASHVVAMALERHEFKGGKW